MNILGINAYHADSAACLVIDGVLVSAVEEERFTRLKHCAGFPAESIRYCLDVAEISIDSVDYIAINRDPRANRWRKGLYALRARPSLSGIFDRFRNRSQVKNIADRISESLGLSDAVPETKIINIEHHLAHLSSAFFVSPFNESAVLSIDGFGDFSSTMWGVGRENKIQIVDKVHFPHSLGLFYLAVTQYLGFPRYGDEYKVMGLAPYGGSDYVGKIRNLVIPKEEGRFELNLDYFIHHSRGVKMNWQSGEPSIDPVFSDQMIDLLGPPRKPDEKIEKHHRDIAAAAQFVYEEAFFHILNHVQTKTGMTNLSLAGGCGMNSVANGKIFRNTGFMDLYVQSASGDAGGAIGAAFAVWNQKLGKKRIFCMKHSYWGPEFSRDLINDVLKNFNAALDGSEFSISFIPDEPDLLMRTSKAIAEGKVVGWFQGRMEWGPRALGNRSILCDPRRADMKEIMNLKIKRRESFRPFAPSILREDTPDWFEEDHEVPFMLQVFQVRENRRQEIPAVTHVNGSGRLQTVSYEQNPRYHGLIKAFKGLTGVPIVLNTSFNENEPVVCRPEEALECFLRTNMDMVVLGDFIVERLSS